MALSKRQRFTIFKRDRFTCQYCGRTPPAVVLEVDHVVPGSGGGSSHPSNLVASCFDCNRGKAHLPLEDRPAAVKDELARQIELREQSQAFNKFLMAERKARDKAVKDLGTYWNDRYQKPEELGKWTFGENRARSVRRFLESLIPAEVMDAMDVAWRHFPPREGQYDDKTFRYFCGVCWNKIRAAEEARG